MTRPPRANHNEAVIGRAVLAALLGLSLWTAAARAVDAVLPSPSTAAIAAVPCLDAPAPDDAGQRAWEVLHGYGVPPIGSSWKSHPRHAALAAMRAFGAARRARHELARPGPSASALPHHRDIPLLI